MKDIAPFSLLMILRLRLGKPAFIAAQGPRWDPDPKKSSATDFLHMVWEHKVGHTLMLCQEHEVR